MTEQQQQQHGDDLLLVLKESYYAIVAAFGPNLLQQLCELHEEGMSDRYLAVYTESQLRRIIRTNIELVERVERSERAVEQAERFAEQAKRSVERAERAELSISMLNGTYLDPIEDVWDNTMVTIPDNYNSIFIRSHHVEIGKDKRYQKTVDEANRDTNAVASQPARYRRFSGRQVDVFNNVNLTGESAHLLPYSDHCGNYWNPIVTLVLNVTANMDSEMEEKKEKKWHFQQKCLHGSKDNNGRKVEDVGIKYFQSNQIQLSGQRIYLDMNTCVLIIPILPAEEVRMWNGNGYDAIVLAGGYKNGRGYDHDDDDDDEAIEIKAAKAYIAIEALEGITAQDVAEKKHCFAEEDDCEKARLLLEQMIFCVSSASIRSIGECGVLDNYDSTTADTYAKETYGLWSTAINTIIENNYQVPIPISKGWMQDKTKVRKISFSGRTDEDCNNPAPDPVLLVAKAASNWLKRNYLPILPGCCSDYDSTDSDDTVSYSVVCARRGWTNVGTTEKNAKIEGINITVNTFSDVDSLTDRMNEVSYF
jgi:hypothetical protein